MNRLVPLLALFAVACGGYPEVVAGEKGEVAEPVSCSLNVTLSGTLEGTIPEEASMGCAPLYSVDSGIDNVFLLANAVAQFQVVIDDVHEGETGSGFPASIYLYDMSSRRWRTPDGACQVDIAEHTFDFTEQTDAGEARAYVVAGTGYCSGEAKPTGQGAYGLVGISEFEFRLPSAWRD
ncbi:MAG TPA: hypothetical protein VM686_08525 [Polyangiaceae bacterium]|jgi:hypothetical protein|nr:hypothetical protein [Polyangiaceae bacterium]